MSSTFEVLNEIPSIDTKDICENLEKYARSYNKNQDLKISDFCVSAVICDSINFIGNDIDYNLRTSYLNDKYAKQEIKEIDPKTLLNILLTNYQAYFDYGIINSIDSHLDYYFIPENNNLDEDDSIDILVDFINYIAKVNDIEVTFTCEQITKIKSKRRCLTLNPRLRNR